MTFCPSLLFLMCTLASSSFCCTGCLIVSQVFWAPSFKWHTITSWPAVVVLVQTDGQQNGTNKVHKCRLSKESTWKRRTEGHLPVYHLRQCVCVCVRVSGQQTSAQGLFFLVLSHWTAALVAAEAALATLSMLFFWRPTFWRWLFVNKRCRH